MIDCTNTTESTFQVLDPIDVAPPGSTLAQYVESGLTQIPIGQQTLTVIFLTTKVSSAYLFDQLEVQNTVDASPLILAPEITATNTTSFTVQFNGVPDTGNSYLRWKVRIPT